MIIGIGKSPLADFVNRSFSKYENVYAYPRFFDNKVLLLENRDRAYIHYIKLLIRNIGKVKIALWPDYISYRAAAKIVNLDLLHNINFIVPIHDIKDIEIGEELEAQGFRVFYGYASDNKYRNYELIDFLKIVKGEKWYLGISSKRELKEALTFGFQGMDITGFLLASKNEQRKDPKVLRRNLEDLLRTISKPQGRQSSILEFFR
ncbi:hypothetical protein SULI_07970 [Saccharolobus solfataricus]|jgi:hypothetical protein|uniref:Uncharacterized protein n=2 Tax=Saccharolobus solfataricus TaxID=2287 RepID=A0A0E3MG66_SACSO|nr:hypothetical protein [Saccharolobus solfataricus]AKA73852.1 hypothetical protein SULB_1594 [Saccharolobus solfataricus]AKA76550.1 hypothetical protein SULC_1592 [Saccharolobus solfataricus]AKA79243.1 hypothetical protein SULA_1593 [Saccharolobus solfataricus]AZF68332.1 hypothetical protein SULG_07970 [Saccharolobus solfataricus]AZF70952.1 hypothetical protein SULH_07970 [Saccharolobus solfataricus]